MIQRFRKFNPMEYIIVCLYYAAIVVYANCDDCIDTGPPLLVTITFVFVLWIYIIIIYILMKRLLPYMLAKIAYLIVFGSYSLQSFFMLKSDLAYSIKYDNFVIVHYIVAYALSFIVVATSLRYYKPLKEATMCRAVSNKSVVAFIIIMMTALPLL